MSSLNPRSKSDKEAKRSANKMTPKQLAIYIALCERRLISACQYHVIKNRIDQRFYGNKTDSQRDFIDLTRSVDQIFSLLGKVARRREGAFAISFRIKSGEHLITLRAEAEKALSKASKKTAPRRGRPSIKPDLALLLYSMIVRLQGDREGLNRLADLIKYDGPIHKTLDVKFDSGTFDSFCFPSISIGEERWERGCKASLKKLAEQKAVPPRFYKNLDKKHAIEIFNKVVREGGFSDYELMLEEKDR